MKFVISFSRDSLDDITEDLATEWSDKIFALNKANMPGRIS